MGTFASKFKGTMQRTAEPGQVHSGSRSSLRPIAQLQRAIGSNGFHQLLQSFSKADQADKQLAPSLQEQAAPAQEPAATESAGPPTETPEVAVSGTIPDITTAPDEGRRTGLEE